MPGDNRDRERALKLQVRVPRIAGHHQKLDQTKEGLYREPQMEHGSTDALISNFPISMVGHESVVLSQQVWGPLLPQP